MTSVFILLFAIGLCHAHNDSFHEELFIKPLRNGHVYTHFQFTTKWIEELESNKGTDLSDN